MDECDTRMMPREMPRKRLDGRSVLKRERLFYVMASAILLLVALVGFRQFVLHGRGADGIPILPQILLVVVFHGVGMLAWVVLMLVQSLLIVSGRRRLHMTLGKVGGVLAVSIVILGSATALLSAQHNAALYESFGGARYFLAFSLTGMVIFGALVVVGIAYRHRPDIHRPMLLLATVASMTGSFDRWPFIEWLLATTRGNVALAHWGPMLLLGAALIGLHAAMTGRPGRWFAVGYASVVGVTIISTLVAGSETWNQLATMAVP